jgi:heme A synthase
MNKEHEKDLRPVVWWLITGCVLIACMVVIGGITRLTGSGLSITEWKPIMGALPPMNDAEWIEAFKKYQAIPEYTLKNQHMDLAGFKRIFFWEYLHRNWGRLMGLVFIVPFVLFWRRGLLKGWLLKRAWLILIGGGLVHGGQRAAGQPRCEPLPPGDPPVCGLHRFLPGAMDGVRYPGWAAWVPFRA